MVRQVIQVGRPTGREFRTEALEEAGPEQSWGTGHPGRGLFSPGPGPAVLPAAGTFLGF